MTDKILLQGLKFYGHHGLLDQEKKLGQLFIVDLELEADLRPAGRSDCLEESVDYAAVYERVRKIVEEERFHILEALAERLAGVLLTIPRLTGVRVKVAKPQPPIRGPLQTVAVEIYRRR
ncbi:MAG: 7,8-dihydroneopterin aldolase/epimerase/oxygenase [Clostridia bacterium]|nr:7,8-dihydroneopterin aldolase/epimerase/oxygenase [Clostridia bacterium]